MSEARARLPLSLNFVDGQGGVTLSQATNAGAARLETLDLEIPGLRFPFDATGGARHFRHRRCRLREATLVCSARMATRWLGERIAAAPFGCDRLQLRFQHGLWELTGVASVGDAHADFLLRGLVHGVGGSAIELSVCDLRIFGPFPIPAPLLAGGLLQTLGGKPSSDGGPFELRIVGCCDLQLDPLRLSLLDTFPAAGWRLPATPVHLRLLELSGRELRLHYAAAAADEQHDQAPQAIPARHVATQEAKRLFGALERLVLDGQHREALEGYHRELERHPRHPFVFERLLQLLSTNPEHDEQTLRLCRDASRTFADFPPAILAEAAVLTRQQALSAAATQYRRLADIAAAADQATEEMLARLAAGRCAIVAEPARARADFERVLELSPDEPRALAHLARIYGETEHWPELLEIRQRQIALAEDDAQRVQAHLELGDLFRIHIARPDQARQQYQLALGRDPGCEPALLGLAEACIDGEQPLEAVSALDRLHALAKERGDVKTQVSTLLRVAALWEHIGDRANALARLQLARRLQPTDPAANRRTAMLLLATDQVEAAVHVLSELADVVHDPATGAELRRQLAELQLHRLGNREAAQREINRALALDPTDGEALRLAVACAEGGGDPEALADALGKLASVAPSNQRPELLLRRGRLLAGVAERRADAESALLQATSNAADDGWAASRELAALRERDARWEEALESWLRALATDRGQLDREGWYRLARVHLRLDQPKDARSALLAALADVLEGHLQLTPAGRAWQREALEALVDVCRELQDASSQARAIELLLPLISRLPDPESAEASSLANLLAELAQIRLDGGDAAAAIDALEQALRLRPDDQSMLDRVAALYERARRWDEARAALNKLLELSQEGNRPALALRLGAVAARQGRNREAIEYYRRALNAGLSEGDKAHAWRRIVALHLARGDATSAARAAEAAASEAPSPARTAEHLFEAAEVWLKRASRIDDAIRCLEQALALDVPHRGVLDMLESIFAEQGNSEGLARVLRRKIELAADQPLVQRSLLARLGEALVQLGDMEGARTAHASALALDQRFVPALRFLADDAVARDQPREAERRYRQLIEALSTPAETESDRAERGAVLVDVHARMAELARLAGRAEEEERHLDAAIEHAPTDRALLDRLDALLLEQNRPRQRAEVLARRMALADDDDEAATIGNERARLLGELGLVDEALEAYHQLLARAPDNSAALQGMADLLRVARRWEELLGVLDQLIEHADGPAAAALLTDAGRVAVKLRQQGRARGYFERTLRIDPDNLPALDQMLDLLRAREAFDRLDELLERRIRLEQDRDARAAQRLERARLRVRRGDLSGAAEQLQQGIDAGDHNAEYLLLAGHVAEQLQDWPAAAQAYGLMRDAAATVAEEKHALRKLLELPSTEDGPELATRLLELDPSDREALGLLAAAQERQRAFGPAAETLQRMLDALPAETALDVRIEVSGRLARALHAADEPQRAGLALTETIKQAGDDPALLAPLAAVARDLDLGELELATLRLLPPDGATLLRIAALHERVGQRAEARDAQLAATQALGGEAERIGAARELYRLADVDRDDASAEDLAAAIAALTVLDEVAAASGAERWTLAQLLARADRPADALALVDLLDDDVAGEVERRELRWRLLEASGDESQLAEEVETAARQIADPVRRAEALVDASIRWAERAARLDRAFAVAAETARLQPGQLALLDRCNACFVALGAAEQTLAQLSRLADSEDFESPVQAELLCRVADLQRDTPTDRQFSYERAIERDPRCTRAHRGLVDVCRERADREALVAALRRWAEVAPTSDARVSALLEASTLLCRELERPDDGLPLLRRARELEDSPRVLRLAAELQLERGNLAETEEALLALADAGDDAEDALTRASGLARTRGDRAAETRYLKRLALLRPSSPHVSLRLANAYRDAGDLAGLRASLEHLGDTDSQALLELASLCAGPLNDPNAAHAAYKKLLDREPDNRKALQGQADVCRELGRHAELADAIRRLHDLEPEEAGAARGKLSWRLAATLRDHLDDPAGARTALERAVDEFGAGDLWADAVRQLLPLVDEERRGELIARLARAEKATRRELRQLGDQAEKRDQLQLAAVAYRQLHHAEPMGEASVRLARVLRAQGEDAELADLLDQMAIAALASGRAANAAEHLMELAALSEKLQQPDRQEQALWRAAGALPERAGVVESLLAHLRGKNDPTMLAEALRRFSPRVDADRRVALLEELANVYDQLRQADKALEVRDTILKEAPERTDLLLPLLQAAMRRAQRSRARRLLRAAREHELLDGPTTAGLLAQLAALELDVENTTAARELAEEAIQLAPRSAPVLGVMRELALHTGDNRVLADTQLALAELAPNDERHDLMRRAASALRMLPDQHERCVAVHRQILAEHPGDNDTRLALERLLRVGGPSRELVTFLEQELPQRRGSERQETLAELAQVERQLGNTEGALAAWRQALEVSPDDPAVLLEMVDCLADVGRFGEARPLLERALEADLVPRGRRPELTRALAYHLLDEVGDRENGMRWLAETCAAAPEQEEPFRRLLALYLDQRRFSEARELLERRLELAPDPALWRALAELLDTHLDEPLQTADAYARAYRGDRTGNRTCGLRAAQLLASAAEFEEGAALLDELLTDPDDPSRPDLQVMQAHLLGKLGRRSEAITLLEQALTVVPEHHQAHLELGDMLRLEGQPEAAIPYLQYAADSLVDPARVARAALLAAQCLEHLGMVDDAIARFEQAASADPGCDAAYRSLIPHYRSRKRLDRLALALRALVALSPAGIVRRDLLFELGCVLEQARDVEQAIACFGEVLQLDPRHLEATSALRALMQQSEQWRACAQLLEREIELAPDARRRATAHRSLGRILAGPLQEPQGAIVHLSAAVQIDEDDAGAMAELVALFEQTGQPGEAGRLLLLLADNRSGGARRATLMRAAADFEKAGWIDEARRVHQELVTGDDEAAKQASRQLDDLPRAGEAAPRAALERIDTEQDSAPSATDAAESPPAQRRHTTPGIAPTSRAIGDEHGDIDTSYESPDRANEPPSASAESSAMIRLEQYIDRLVEDGQWEAAAEALRSHADATPDLSLRAGLLLRLGHTLEYRLERPFEALEVYHEAAAASPDQRSVVKALADAAYRHQDWRRAAEAYDWLSEMTEGEDRLEIAYRRGVVYEALGALETADTFYAEALERAPRHRPTIEARSRLALQRGDIDEALELLTTLARMMSTDEVANLAELRRQLGELHLRKGNLPSAHEYLEGALAIDGRNVKCMQLLLTTHERMGSLPQAAALLQRLISHTADPEMRASLLHHRAMLLAKLGDEEQAVDCLLRAYDIAPTHVPTLWRLVDYYWTQNDLVSMVEVGDELAGLKAFGTPDLRHARLAIALLLSGAGAERAHALLRGVLADPALVPPAMLDLATAVDRGAPVDRLAALALEADTEGVLRANAAHVAHEYPDVPGLPALTEAVLAER